MNHNNDVNGLWIGGVLSPLAKLTLHTFLRHHGPFYLWTYDTDMDVPPGVRVLDANEIIPASEVFSYEDGPAQGSYAGFSDVFRAKLLFQRGGWWTDMDVALMKPIPDSLLSAQTVLRRHWRFHVVGNLMKFPAESPAMRMTYETTRRYIDAQNLIWEKPIQLLARSIHHHRLERYCHSIGHDDQFVDVLPFVRLPLRIPNDWWAMHWCNEMWRRKHFHLNIHPESHYSLLLREYGLSEETAE